jgi:hypothetical protein
LVEFPVEAVTKDELIALLQPSQLPESCITDQYAGEMLQKSDVEIRNEIVDSLDLG